MVMGRRKHTENTKRQKNLVGGLKNGAENEKLADRIMVNVKMVHDGSWTPACAGS